MHRERVCVRRRVIFDTSFKVNGQILRERRWCDLADPKGVSHFFGGMLRFGCNVRVFQFYVDLEHPSFPTEVTSRVGFIFDHFFIREFPLYLRCLERDESLSSREGSLR